MVAVTILEETEQSGYHLERKKKPCWSITWHLSSQDMLKFQDIVKCEIKCALEWWIILNAEHALWKANTLLSSHLVEFEYLHLLWWDGDGCHTVVGAANRDQPGHPILCSATDSPGLARAARCPVAQPLTSHAPRSSWVSYLYQSQALMKALGISKMWPRGVPFSGSH